MALYNKEAYIDSIGKHLAFVSTYIQIKTKNGLTDSAHHSEDFFAEFLNLAFGYHLTNVNFSISNYPAIDLADEFELLAIQVTATNTNDKFRSTVEKFCAKGLHKQYDRLLILCIGEQIGKTTFRSRDIEIDGFKFSYKESLWDMTKLFGLLRQLGTEKLEKLDGFFERELSSYQGPRRTSEATGNWPPTNSRWCHETTENDFYVPRTDYLVDLTKKAKREHTRIISITGMGGTGKTSLMGYWLKEHDSPIGAREVKGLFYWSFYAESDVRLFLKALWEYLEANARYLSIRDLLSAPKTKSGIRKKTSEEPIDLLTRNFLKLPPIVLALDGLEVVQETLKDEGQYGAFIDLRLRDLIYVISQAKQPWLCVLTSRFPITDFSLSPSSKSLEVMGLTHEEGSRLLLNKGVFGDHFSRARISQYFEGHPLALLLFSSVAPTNLKHEPLLYLHKIFDCGEDPELKHKMIRLLDYYQRHLELNQKSVVMVMSIFRAPVSLKTIEAIYPGILSTYFKEDIPTEEIQKRLHFAIANLGTTGILIIDNIAGTEVYACHPVVRDYFRTKVVSNDSNTASYAVDILKNRPDDLHLVGVSEIETYVLAIELLSSALNDESLSEALMLYGQRLDKGLKFVALGLANEGKRCCAALLRSYENRSMNSMGFYSRRSEVEVALLEFHYRLGEYEQVIHIGESSYEEYQTIEQGRIARALARTCIRTGDYNKAFKYIGQATKVDEGLLGKQNQSYESLSIDYYVQAELCADSGMFAEAEKYLEMLVSNGHLVDSALDGLRLYSSMAELKIGIHRKDMKCVRRCIQRLNQSLPTNISEFFDLEIELLLSHGYFLDGNHSKAVALSKKLRELTLKRSLSYEFCYSTIIHTLSTNKISKHSDFEPLQQIFDQTRALKMTPLYYQVLTLLPKEMLEVNDVDLQSIKRLVESKGGSTNHWFE